MINKKHYILLLLILTYFNANAQNFDFKGQADSWLFAQPFDGFIGQLGLRYIPEVNYKKVLKDTSKFDADISIKSFITGTNYNSDSGENNADINLYRFWVRYSSKQFELRAGLQKINFGPATMLRSLMWFDQIDPRDPLQLTNGVYGILARYYFLNNTNIWLWGLYGNENPKGWETVKSNQWRPEFGGRIQFNALKGEIGISGHNREVDFRKDTSEVIKEFGLVNETKFGLDGRWDWIIGIWFEAVIINQDIDTLFPWTKQLNLGIDYTFGVGKGLHVVSEYFAYNLSKEPFTSGQGIGFSALSVRYPIGIMDQIMAMVYYDWTNDSWYRFINWGRQYDKLSLNLMCFWNPDKFQMYQNLEENMLFTGAGFQFILVYNH